jgi:hypothetical protein
MLVNHDKNAADIDKNYRYNLIEKIIEFTGNLESVNWDYISTQDIEFFVRAFYQKGIR